MGEGVRRTDEGKKMSRQKRIRPAQITQASERAKILRQNMTEAEQRLWHHLRDRRLQGYKFRRQQPIGRYIADFVFAVVVCAVCKPGLCSSAAEFFGAGADFANHQFCLFKPAGVFRQPLGGGVSAPAPGFCRGHGRGGAVVYRLCG